MNHSEQLALDSASKNYEQRMLSGRLVWHEGASKLVAGMVMHDICEQNPNLDIQNLSDLAALANQYSCTDGLLAPLNLEYPMPDAYLILNHQIAVTTIWIAQFTKDNTSSRTHSALHRKQKNFQACILYYFFNQFVGAPPAKLSRSIEQATVKQFGLFNWFFDYSYEHELRKSALLFDTMHTCALEYQYPKIGNKSIL